MTRKLVRLCIHEQIRGHEIHCSSSNCLIPQDHDWCPGGEFLPEDALVIEKDGEGIERLAKAWHLAQEQHRARPTYWEEQSADYKADRRTKAQNLFDALADQVGEPG